MTLKRLNLIFIDDSDNFSIFEVSFLACRLAESTIWAFIDYKSITIEGPA